MNQHYYSENPVSDIKEKNFSSNIKDATLNFTSVSGVFSFSDRVDKASQLLIENFIPTAESVLDIGCGYGAIGLFIKALYNNQLVFMSDINNRAIEYCQLNAKINNLNVKIFKSNLFSEASGMEFDDIVSNPPIAAGKKLNTELIEHSFHHLRNNGSLWLVAFHNKGGSTLKKIMEATFGNVQDVEKSGGIRVYRSVKKKFSI